MLLVNSIDLPNHRFGYIGLENDRMFPVLHPGAFVMIDDSMRKVHNSGWVHEWERPIYFLENRDGYVCGWCNLREDKLLVSAPPASRHDPLVFEFPREIDIVGTIRGVAMVLTPHPQHSTRP